MICFGFYDVVRFLRVRNFDVVKAKDLYSKYLKWRDEFKVEKIVKVRVSLYFDTNVHKF